MVKMGLMLPPSCVKGSKLVSELASAIALALPISIMSTYSYGVGGEGGNISGDATDAPSLPVSGTSAPATGASTISTPVQNDLLTPLPGSFGGGALGGGQQLMSSDCSNQPVFSSVHPATRLSSQVGQPSQGSGYTGLPPQPHAHLPSTTQCPTSIAGMASPNMFATPQYQQQQMQQPLPQQPLPQQPLPQQPLPQQPLPQQPLPQQPLPQQPLPQQPLPQQPLPQQLLYLLGQQMLGQQEPVRKPVTAPVGYGYKDKYSEYREVVKNSIQTFMSSQLFMDPVKGNILMRPDFDLVGKAVCIAFRMTNGALFNAGNAGVINALIEKIKFVRGRNKAFVDSFHKGLMFLGKNELRDNTVLAMVALSHQVAANMTPQMQQSPQFAFPNAVLHWFNNAASGRATSEDVYRVLNEDSYLTIEVMSPKADEVQKCLIDVIKGIIDDSRFASVTNMGGNSCNKLVDMYRNFMPTDWSLRGILDQNVGGANFHSILKPVIYCTSEQNPKEHIDAFLACIESKVASAEKAGKDRVGFFGQPLTQSSIDDEDALTPLGAETDVEDWVLAMFYSQVEHLLTRQSPEVAALIGLRIAVGTVGRYQQFGSATWGDNLKKKQINHY